NLVVVMEGRDDMPVVGGGNFFNTMASKHRDTKAARLGRVMLGEIQQRPKFFLSEDPDVVDQLWSFFNYDPSVPITPPPPTKHLFAYYPDTGLAHFRDTEADVTFSVRCGAAFGYHAY